MEFSDLVPDKSHDNSSSEFYDESSVYSTTSLNSSIYDYRFENGRRYHAYAKDASGKYPLPNDEAEQERLDIIHHIYLILMNDKLHLAPIDPNPQNILDVGTGTGIWAIDAGERYQSAKVIGTDLSPIQPSWVPPNVEFQIDDVESDWTFKEDYFDLVHIRHLGGAIKDWEKLFVEAYKHCKPGGWIDVAEYEMEIFCDDGTLPDNPDKPGLKRFYYLINKATEKTGRPFGISKQLKPILEKAGFTDVHSQEAKIPVGPWATDRKQKEMGAYTLLCSEDGFEAFGIQLFTRVLGIDTDEAQLCIQEAVKQAKNRKIHSYGKHYLYYGQKPVEES